MWVNCFVAGNQVSIPQTHFSAGRKTEIIFGRRFHEIVAQSAAGFAVLDISSF
jgi:hypothetical protein